MWKLFRPKKDLVFNQRFYSTRERSFEEFSFPVPWGKVAGKWWGSKEIQPLICLHGYQDNCGSFNKLIPLIETPSDLSFLALDLPGHGYSSPYPKGMVYNFMSSVILVEQIRNYFRWPTLSFMSHSYGAIICYTYAMSYPEKVNFLICMDGLFPLKNKVSAEIMRKNIDQFLLYHSKEGSNKSASYTLEEIMKKMTTSFRNSISLETAQILCERNIAPSKEFPGKYYFTRDPVLRVRSPLNWPTSQLIADASRITPPLFVFTLRQTLSLLKIDLEGFARVLEKSSKDADIHILEGSHYIHLEEPERILPLITKFLMKHYKAENSNLDGIFCEFSKSSNAVGKEKDFEGVI